MIESQWKIQLVPAEHFDFLGVILGNGISCRLGDEDRGDGVLSWISFWIGICVHLALELNVQRGFFFGLPHGCLLQRFSIVDKTPRQSPPIRWILPFDEDDPLLTVLIFNLDDDIDGGRRIFVLFQCYTSLNLVSSFFNLSTMPPYSSSL